MTGHEVPPQVNDTVDSSGRRFVLRAATAWVGTGGFAMAQTQQRGNIAELEGDALLNGKRLLQRQSILSGDTLQTGAGCHVIFVIGNAAFHVRQNSRVTAERGATLSSVGLLRVHKGAVISVWDQAAAIRVATPTLTVTLRSGGLYTEVFEKRRNLSYLCNCYGTMRLNSAGAHVVSSSVYHEAYWAGVEDSENAGLVPAPHIKHSDEELEFLAWLLVQKTAWQISGKKSTKDRPDLTTELLKGTFD